MLFSLRKRNLPVIEHIGLKFANPVGVNLAGEAAQKRHCTRMKTGFLTLTPPKENILEWIGSLQKYRESSLLAFNLKNDILRSFALVYDFADFIIIDPDSDNGISSPDISDTAQLLDEIVNLRLCYVHYTPVFLRLSPEDTPDEIHPLVSCARLSGLDGIVAPDLRKVRLTLEECQSRMPVIGVAQNAEEALEELHSGAILVETQMKPLGISKLLKTLEKQTPTHHD